ncbi:hypothetical protein AB3331_02045 [Streptococcus sp. H49]|uniref:hypothetical protein n=1 Tax=Streptococcus huangxiaojuni TaxID=3237239 RepID=UPI0034A19265
MAKMKAKNAKGWDLKDPSTWSDSTDYRDYVKEYKEKYGSFALADPKALDFAAAQNRLTSLRSQLQSASGSQKILLRQELVTAAAQSAQAKAESFNFRVKSRISQSKETIDSQLKTFERDIRSLSQHLSEGEVSELLSEMSMEKVWDEGNEAAALAEGDRTQEELTDFTQKLMAGAEELTAADQAGAELFR